jgi:hypothetical protein
VAAWTTARAGLAGAPTAKPKWSQAKSKVTDQVAPDGSRQRVWECEAKTKDRVNLMELSRRADGGAPCAPPSGASPSGSAQARSSSAPEICYAWAYAWVYVECSDGEVWYAYAWAWIEVPCASGW